MAWVELFPWPPASSQRAGLSALGSFWVVTPPPPPSGALLGTFHRKEADPAQHRVFFVFPSRWRMWGSECEPLVSGCQSPLTSSLCWLLNTPDVSRGACPPAVGTLVSVIMNRCLPARGHLISPGDLTGSQPLWLLALQLSAPTHCFDAR